MSQSGKIRYRKVPLEGSPSAWATVDPVVVGEASATIDVSGLSLGFGDALEVEGLPDWSRTRSIVKIPPAPVWDTALSAVSPPGAGQSLDVALSPRVTGTGTLTYALANEGAGVSLAGTTLTLDATGLAEGAPLAGTVTVSDAFGQSAASSFALEVGPATTVETLAVTGDPFPVTLYRDGSTYYTNAADYAATTLAGYTGAVIHVASTGNDTTGDGSSGSPYLTIDKAITEATSGSSRIKLADEGPFAFPSSTVTKSLAWLGPDTGVALIGAFNDLTTATITGPTDGRYNIPSIGGGLVRGVLRLDDLMGVVRSTMVLGTSSHASAISRGRAASIFYGSTASNVALPDGGDLPALVATGNLRAWLNTSTGNFTASGDQYIGPNIIMASDDTEVFVASGTAKIVLDRCEVYGGRVSTISAPSGQTVVSTGVRAGGSTADVADYDGTSIGVEDQCVFGYANEGDTENASTAHTSAKVLRTRSFYYGGERTIHDVGDATLTLTFSCTITDATFDEKVLYRIGTDPDTTTGYYGDLTFAGERTADTFFAATATATEVGLTDTWPM